MADEQTTPETQAENDGKLFSAVEEVFGKEAAEAIGAPKSDDTPTGEGEKPAPAKPKAGDEKVAHKLNVSRRAEERASQERQRLKAEKQALEAEREAAKKELADLKEARELAERIKAAKSSPSKLLAESGLSPKEFLKQLANENEPEALQERIASETKTEIQKLREEIAEEKRRAQAEREAFKRQQVDAEISVAQREFVRFVDDNAEKYPNLCERYTEREIAHAGLGCLNDIVGQDEDGNDVTRLKAFHDENGRPPTDEEIAEFLEYAETQRRGETLGAKRQKRQPSEGKTTGETRGTPPESRGQSPRTLTARAASERATGPKPWSQEWADEESLRIFREAGRKAG